MNKSKGINYTCPMLEENEDSNIFACKTLRLMNYLVRNGFDCKKIKKDKFNEKYMVFIFESSKELKECLSRYDNHLDR